MELPMDIRTAMDIRLTMSIRQIILIQRARRLMSIRLAREVRRSIRSRRAGKGRRGGVFCESEDCFDPKWTLLITVATMSLALCCSLISIAFIYFGRISFFVGLISRVSAIQLGRALPTMIHQSLHAIYHINAFSGLFR